MGFGRTGERRAKVPVVCIVANGVLLPGLAVILVLSALKVWKHK